MVTFDPGDSTGSIECFEFELAEDMILEGDELFTVYIADAEEAGLGAITVATVTIEDNDG